MASFRLATQFHEIGRVTMKRGPQTLTLSSAHWLKSGPGNNLVLSQFADDGRGRVSYYVGAVEKLVTCCDQFGTNPRLVAIMSMHEVQATTVRYTREDGSVRRYTLPNLWQRKQTSTIETYMAPVWEITQKVMVCGFRRKNYYCTYE